MVVWSCCWWCVVVVVGCVGSCWWWCGVVVTCGVAVGGCMELLLVVDVKFFCDFVGGLFHVQSCWWLC